MKLKYFNCLTENEKQKTSITEYISLTKSKEDELRMLRVSEA